MPKTAGSSFQTILETYFGARLLLDYGDLPVNTPACLRTGRALHDAATNRARDFGEVECVHGHFLPAKYLPLKSSGRAVFVTWLRDPLERMVSHYNFWKHTFNSASAPALHRRLVEENWSLERFCFCEEMRNLYAQFLWSFPLSFFDFVGLTERFDEDCCFFAQHYLKVSLEELPRKNIGPTCVRTQQTAAQMRSEFERFHREDYQLYAAIATRRINRSTSSPL